MFDIGTLDQLAEIIMGQSPKGSTVSIEGIIPLLNGPTEFGINHPHPVQFTTDPKRFAKKGDLLFCVRGSTGLMNWADQDYAIGRGIAAIRPKNTDSLHFIKGAIQFNLKRLTNAAIGSVITGIKKDDLFKFKCPIPGKKEIIKINEFLGNLSQKIELNQKMNETLEEISKTLFKSWFIDFDPVRAKVEGRPTGLSKEISDLFPVELVESEIGEIPKGWEAVQLQEYITVKRGGSPRPIHDFISKTGLPWVKIRDASASNTRWIPFTKEFIKEEGLKKTVLLQKNELILSNSATPGIPRFLNLDACIHDGWLYFPEKHHFTDQYLYHLFLEIRPHLLNMGSGTVFTNLKTEIIKQHKTVLPPLELLTTFQGQALLIHEQCNLLLRETETLSELRDTLLPKLISGELKIPDAENLVDEVGI